MLQVNINTDYWWNQATTLTSMVVNNNVLAPNGSPAGGTTSWNVQYEANELPDAATPAWTHVEAGTSTEEILNGSVLHIVSANGNNRSFYITDPAGFGNAVGMTYETSFKLVSGLPWTGNGIQACAFDTPNGTKQCCMSIGIGSVYFTDGQNAGGTYYVMNTQAAFHTYRVTVLNSTGNVYVDGVLRITKALSAAGGDNYIDFGTNYGGGGGNEAEAYWDYVYYATGGAFAPATDQVVRGLYISQSFPPRGGWNQLGWTATTGTYIAKLSVLDEDNNYVTGYSGLTASTVNLSGLGLGSSYRVQIEMSGTTSTQVSSYYVGYPGQTQVVAGTNSVILDRLQSMHWEAGGRGNTGYFKVVVSDTDLAVYNAYKKNDEIQIREASLQSGLPTKAFGGFIDNLTADTHSRTTTIEGRGYGAAAQNTTVNKTYTSIETGSIVREIFGNVAGLTTTNVSGTSTTPKSWAVNDEDCWSVGQKLADHVGYNLFIDVNKAVFFQPDSYTRSNSTSSVVYGKNMYSMSQKNRGQDTVNTINVYGQTEIVSGLGSFTGDGLTKSFAINQIPLSPLTKVQTPSGTTKAEFTDFNVSYNAATILFLVAPLLGSPVYVDYKWPKDIFATASDAQSVATYGSIKKKIYNDSLVNGSDAQTFANAWVAAHSGTETVYEAEASQCDSAQPYDSIMVYNPKYNISGNLTIVSLQSDWRIGKGLKRTMVLGTQIPDVNTFIGAMGNRISRLETNYKNTGFGTPLTSTQAESVNETGSATWVWYSRGTAGVYRNSTYRTAADVYRGTWTVGSTATVTET